MPAPQPREPRLPVVPTTALGILSIVAFGGWFYGYGVLVEPIGAATGWSESALGGTYGASLLLTGIGGAAIGRALDLRGSRATFLALAAATVALLFVAASAASVGVFVVAAALGGGLVGAGGYYNATSAVMARLVPHQRARGITAITLFGAFASPIALPVLGRVVATVGWRATLRGIAVAVGVGYVVAALGVPDVRPDTGDRPHLLAAVRGTVAGTPRRALVAAGVVAGMSTSVLLVQQVPAMVDAGMTLAVASTWAGARGFLQLGGRLPLPRVIGWIGARRTLLVSYALAGVGALVLIGAGGWVQALAYVVVAGLAIGALAAVEGIYAAEVFDGPALATQLGVFGLARGVGAAIGPTLGGIAIDLTGSRTPALLLAAATGLAAAALLTGWITRARSPAAAPPGAR